MREWPIPTSDNGLRKELPPVSWSKRGLETMVFLQFRRFGRHFPERKMREAAVATYRIGTDQKDRSGRRMRVSTGG
jgi:hypothetical protein